MSADQLGVAAAIVACGDTMAGLSKADPLAIVAGASLTELSMVGNSVVGPGEATAEHAQTC